MNPKPKKETKTELTQTALRLPKDKHRQLKLIAVQQDKSLNDLLIEGVDYVLKKYKSK